MSNGIACVPPPRNEPALSFAPGTSERDPVDHYVSEVVIHGTPEAVRDQLEKLRSEMHLSYLLTAPLSEGSFQLFTDRVLPHLT